MSVALSVSVIFIVTILWFGETTLSANGKGDATIAKFTELLDLDKDGTDGTPNKAAKLMTYLQENMDPEKFSQVQKILSEAEDITNAELLKRLEVFLQEKKKEDEDEYPKPDEKDMMTRKEFMSKCMAEGKSLEECAAEYKEQEPTQAAKFLASYKEFLATCMKDGKSIAECAKEWKKKYPEPSKKEAAEAGVEDLAKELKKDDDKDDDKDKKDEEDKKMKALEDRIKGLEAKLGEQIKAAELAEVKTEVNKLVSEKHLTPKQAPIALKLSAVMEPSQRDELFEFFRTTQVFAVDKDMGRTQNTPPGVTIHDITPERRKELVHLHGLSGLIEDKADKTRKDAWWRENN